MSDQKPMFDQKKNAGFWIAIILSSGIALALNVVTFALLYVAILRLNNPTGIQGLSENGTQLLTGWGGGIIGVLGAYVGYSFGSKVGHDG